MPETYPLPSKDSLSWIRIPSKRFVEAFITSDLHLGHKNIPKLTGRELDFEERIMEELRELDEASVLIVLGDSIMDKKWVKPFRELEAFKILVKGNHDHVNNRKLYNAFDLIVPSLLIKYEIKPGKILNVFAYHYPIPTDKVRNLIGYHVDFVVSGHTHKPPFYLRKHRIFNLCPEVAGYKPIPLSELTDIYREVKKDIESKILTSSPV